MILNEQNDQQKFNATINDYLWYDLSLDLSGDYSDLEYTVILTRVTNANFN